MISLVVDLRDPELQRLGVSGGEYRPVKVTVAPSRVVRLATGAGGGFLFDGAPVVKWATTAAAVTFAIPATDGAEIVASDRSTFVYNVTVKVDPPGTGKGREPRSITFSGLLPNSLGASVSVAQLMEPPGPLTLSQYQELDQRVDELEAAPGGGVTDHGALTGHGDDDHPQYLTDARGDARYYTKAANDILLAGKAPTSHTHTIANVTGLQTALDGKQAAGSYAPAAHTHAQADVTNLTTDLAGKVPTSRNVTAGTGLTGGGDLTADRTLAVAYGTTAGTAVQGNDARLSDARTPTAHTHTASQVSDSTATGRSLLTAADAAAARTAIGAGTSSLALGTTGTTAAAGNHTHTPASIGAAAATHTHPAADLTATGTRDATTFLRGDNTWAVPAGGSSDPWSYAIATADTSNSTVTAANAAGLSIPALANGLYEFRIFVLVTSAATTVGAQVGLAVSGSGAVVTAYGVGNNGAAASVSAFPGSAQLPMTVASLNAATASSQMVGAVIEGTIRASSMTGSVDVTIKSETAGSAVAVKTDSFIRYRRIGN